MDFAKKLKETRTEKGYTQKDISKTVNKTITAICDWERGRTQPSIEDLIKISQLLECSIDYLVGIENEDGIIIQNQTSPILTIEEERLLQTYRQLDSRKKKLVEYYADSMIELTKEEKRLG